MMIIMEILENIRPLYRTFHFQVWTMSLIIQGRKSRQVPSREAIVQLHVPGVTPFFEEREMERVCTRVRERNASECEAMPDFFREKRTLKINFIICEYIIRPVITNYLGKKVLLS